MKNYEQMGKNIECIVDTEELFTTFMYFLHEKKDYKELNLYIGTYTYEDGWTIDINCVLESYDGTCNIYFTETRYDKLISEPLTNQIKLIDLCYGWGFDQSTININFDIINDYMDMLDNYDNDLFWEMYHDIHAEFW